MNSLPEHSWLTSMLRRSDKRSHKALIDSYTSKLRDVFLRCKECWTNDSGQPVDFALGTMKDMEPLGLRFHSEAERIVVDARELFDIAIVSRCVGFVVAHLYDLMSRTDNVESATHYLQSYIGVLTVLQSSYDRYLSANDRWRIQLARIRDADSEETVRKSADAYIGILAKHAEIIKSKAEEAAAILLEAETFYKTVSLSDEVRSLIRPREALLQLELPPIEFASDAAFQAEFAALTQRLKN